MERWERKEKRYRDKVIYVISNILKRNEQNKKGKFGGREMNN